VVIALGIGPAADDHALIIDAIRAGEGGAGVVKLEVGSVRESQEAVQRGVGIGLCSDHLAIRIARVRRRPARVRHVNLGVGEGLRERLRRKRQPQRHNRNRK